MSNHEATTQVTILGETFQIRGGERALVESLANQVDARFREVQAARPTVDMKRLAVMVCLNLAEELHRERTLHRESIHQAREKARHCRESLEEVFPGGGRPVAKPVEK